jgi:hypothetical protein
MDGSMFTELAKMVIEYESPPLHPGVPFRVAGRLPGIPEKPGKPSVPYHCPGPPLLPFGAFGSVGGLPALGIAAGWVLLQLVPSRMILPICPPLLDRKRRAVED